MNTKSEIIGYRNFSGKIKKSHGKNILKNNNNRTFRFGKDEILGKCTSRTIKSTSNKRPQPKPYRYFRFGKGQAPLLTHAIMVGFSIFLVYAVISTLTSIKADYQKLVGDSEVNELCFIMKSAIDKVYLPDNYNLSANTNLGSLEISLPDRITDLKYDAKFFNRSILIKSSVPAFNETCKIGYNIAYNGSTSGGLTRVSYIKQSNGTEVIEMVKV